MLDVLPSQNISDQKKSIIKTIVLIVVLMATILTLFLNKITTPRYLSNIELKVNGLILRSDEYSVTIDDKTAPTWLLLAGNDQQKILLNEFHQSLKPSLRKQINIISDGSELLPTRLVKDGTIPVIKPSGEYFAYLKPPYDTHKMTLTLSSVITHR